MRVFVPQYRRDKTVYSFSLFFEQYWPGAELVIFPNLGKYWTNDIIEYFKNKVEDEYFALFLEDSFIVREVDLEVIKECEKMIKWGFADKIELTGAFFTRYDLIFYREIQGVSKNIQFFEVSQHDPYRATLHPSIWRRDYFMSLLKPNMNIWQFELKNAPTTYNDEKKILAVRPVPCGIINYIRNGAVNMASLNEIREEDKVFL